MHRNPLAAWELRIGSMRAYYRVQETEHLVQVLAIGIKRRHQVYLGERVVEL